jgi:hypothetical protein
VDQELLMNLLQVLVVPITVAIAVPLLDWLLRNREQAIQQLQKERELAVANNRTQDEALQAYLDKMTELLVDYGLGKPQNNTNELQEDPLRTVAWARTKTVLRRLDGDRKGTVLRFLQEADLIKRGHPVIRSISGADLVCAKLEGCNLIEARLPGVHLSRAVLTDANLTKADLTDADLIDANLTRANLTEADLTRAKVSKE